MGHPDSKLIGLLVFGFGFGCVGVAAALGGSGEAQGTAAMGGLALAAIAYALIDWRRERRAGRG